MTRKTSIERVGKNPITESLETLREICFFLHKVHTEAKGAKFRHGQDMIQWAKKKRIRRPKQLQGAKVTFNTRPKLRPGKDMVLAFEGLPSPVKPIKPHYGGESGPERTTREGYWVRCFTIDKRADSQEELPWVIQICVKCQTRQIVTSLGTIVIPEDLRCRFIVTDVH